MTRRRAFDTEFGAAVSVELAKAQLSQTALAEQVGTAKSYVSAVLNGTKPAGARWADLIADALKLNEADRARLHLHAARDAGYKLPNHIDLSPGQEKTAKERLIESFLTKGIAFK